MDVDMFREDQSLIGEQRAIQEYRLLVIPDNNMDDLLALEKGYAEASYGKAIAWSEKPGIELLAFHARVEMENTLLRWMNRICGQSEVFSLSFNNYGSMPGLPLYIRMEDAQPLQSLAAAFLMLDGWLKSNGMGTVRLPRTHRLLLVEKLEANRELEILLDFSARSFRSEMEVSELVLIRAGGQVISRLPLAPRGRRFHEQ